MALWEPSYLLCFDDLGLFFRHIDLHVEDLAVLELDLSLGLGAGVQGRHHLQTGPGNVSVHSHLPGDFHGSAAKNNGIGVRIKFCICIARYSVVMGKTLSREW